MPANRIVELRWATATQTATIRPPDRLGCDFGSSSETLSANGRPFSHQRGARMHTVELLEESLSVVKRLGYRIRHEWLNGTGGGGCEIAGQKWFFLDLALGPGDQLEQVLETLRREPAAGRMALSIPLGEMVGLRRSA
jgi:hypothetical protein